MFGVVPDDFGGNPDRMNAVRNGPPFEQLVDPPVGGIDEFIVGNFDQQPDERLQPGQLHADGEPALEPRQRDSEQLQVRFCSMIWSS